MAVSAPVRAYYTKHIFLQSGRDKVPKNFRPLEGPCTGKSSVEGCAGGGKNILEIFLCGDGDRVKDVRASCGLCNPAMYAAADVLCDWARGKPCADLLAVDPLSPAALAPFFTALGCADRADGPDLPEDAREKFQYALFALQNAARAHLGQPVSPPPKFPPPADRNAE